MNNQNRILRTLCASFLLAVPAALAQQPGFTPLAVQPTRPVRGPAAAASAAATAQPGFTPLEVQPTRPAAPAPRAAAPAPAPYAAPQPVAVPPAEPATYSYEPGTHVVVNNNWPANDMDKSREEEESVFGKLALGPRIGTTGIGGDLTLGLFRAMNIRGGFGYATFNISPKIDHIKYDIDVDFITIPVLIDLHPFDGGFRVSGGIYIQPGTEAKVSGRPDKSRRIGDHTYTASILGELTGSVKPRHKVAPYFGIGYGNAVSPLNRWNFAFDLGVIFQAYDVDLAADGAVITDPGLNQFFAADIKKEEDSLQDDFDKFKFYPVLSFGFTYNFN
jgi:hypothetical protein